MNKNILKKLALVTLLAAFSNNAFCGSIKDILASTWNGTKTANKHITSGKGAAIFGPVALVVLLADAAIQYKQIEDEEMTFGQFLKEYAKDMMFMKSREGKLNKLSKGVTRLAVLAGLYSVIGWPINKCLLNN
ncbi:hypothetical protein ACFLY6_00370 [Candidatus Dependentiae bacterium]